MISMVMLLDAFYPADLDRTCSAGKSVCYTNAVKIKAKDQTITEGEKKQLKVTLKGEEKGLPILAHGGAVRYESLNPDIATVDKDGNMKGVSTGSCKILLSTADGLRKTIVLTVKAGPEELRFGKKKYKVEVGKTLNLKKMLKIFLEDAKFSLKWKSSDKSIAKFHLNRTEKRNGKGRPSVPSRTKKHRPAVQTAQFSIFRSLTWENSFILFVTSV